MSKGLLNREQAVETLASVWNRTESTTTITEPLLRRHAKLLLVSFALLPFGLELLDLPSGLDVGLLPTLLSTRNIVACVLLLGPVLLLSIFGLINMCGSPNLRRLAFGGSIGENFSVLSFFVHRVHGLIERKQIKSPIDSISSFQSIFSALIDTALVQAPDLPLVIVIDNIDRIPAQQAREFWSTMQNGNTG